MSAELANLTIWPTLLAVDPTSSAFQAGRLVGMIVGVLLVLGLGIFGVVAIIQACVKRTTGWIVVGSIAGLFFMVVLVGVLVGFVAGFKQGFEGVRARSAAGSTSAASPARVTGQAMPYTIDQPAGWQLQRKQAAYDVVVSDRGNYVGVIAEEADLGSAENVAQFAHKQISAAGADVTIGENEPITIDGRQWVGFTAKCKVQNLPFAYQYYVYSGKEGTVQVMGWTFQNLWDREAPTLRKVMQSFRFPVAKEAAATAP